MAGSSRIEAGKFTCSIAVVPAILLPLKRCRAPSPSRAEPTVTKADYAKWMLDDPRVNFSIMESAEGATGIQHLGIEAETEGELQDLRQRIGSLEGEVFDEGETICCYHASDKTWVTDAQGVSWETFYTSGEADSLQAPAGDGEGACCETTCCT